MTTHSTTQAQPFQLGDAHSFRALTLIPLFPAEAPEFDYIGLDEAVARGLGITELGRDGVVEALWVDNPLDENVLLYEGEELAGAKQNRILDKITLVHARIPAKVPVKCVERGRWSHRSEQLEPAPRVAYPSLRRAKRDGQGAVWANISAKQARLSVASPTDASEQMYLSRSMSLDEYERALPRVDGQSGVIVGIGGALVCLDFVSRSDVFAGLYQKLLRSYALDAIESRSHRPLSSAAVGRFLGELELVLVDIEPGGGPDEYRVFDNYAVGYELILGTETISLTASPARAA